LRPDFQGQAEGNTMEPTGEHLSVSNSTGPPRQRQKGGLEHVIDIGSRTQDPAGNTQYQGAVAMQELLEGYFVAILDKVLQQYGVGNW
jgi:hypothetical protein